jgi:holliday junction DNA helicase RuvA
MIALVSGEVVSSNASTIVIKMAGLGFEVHVPARVRATVGAELTLHTKMVVREDAISLFGFETVADREAFDTLCAISGVGPKLALAILSSLDSSALAQAVANQNETLLRSIAGVGPKSAKLILLSLTGKLATGSKLVDALISLGTPPQVATELASRVDSGLDDAQALKQALALMGERKLS